MQQGNLTASTFSWWSVTRLLDDARGSCQGHARQLSIPFLLHIQTRSTTLADNLRPVIAAAVSCCVCAPLRRSRWVCLCVSWQSERLLQQHTLGGRVRETRREGRCCRPAAGCSIDSNLSVVLVERNRLQCSHELVNVRVCCLLLLQRSGFDSFMTVSGQHLMTFDRHRFIDLRGVVGGKGGPQLLCVLDVTSTALKTAGMWRPSLRRCVYMCGTHCVSRNNAVVAVVVVMVMMWLLCKASSYVSFHHYSTHGAAPKAIFFWEGCSCVE